MYSYELASPSSKRDTSVTMSVSTHPLDPPESASEGRFYVFYQIRYMLARPLQIKILPSFIPVVPLPILKDLPYITVGQVLLMLPWVILFMFGYWYTFHSNDLSGGGKIASYAILAAFLTANKSNSIFNFVFGLSFERMVTFHRLYSVLAVILSFFHGYVAFVYGQSGKGSSGRRLQQSQYGLYSPTSNLWKFLWDGSQNTTGTICLIFLMALVAVSFLRIFRKHFFEIWLLSHILFALVVMLFGILHSATILLVPLFWWLLDSILRYEFNTQYRFPKTATLLRCGDDLVEVTFLRTFDFRAGQFVRICVSNLSRLQFHPITISSAPFQKYATLHIKAVGEWSKELVALAGKTSDVAILIEGPYGNLSFDMNNDELYDVFLFIAGGIGVTPCDSIARQLIHEAEEGGKGSRRRRLSHLSFVWVVRDISMINAIPTVATDGTMDGFEQQGKNKWVDRDPVVAMDGSGYEVGFPDWSDEAMEPGSDQFTEKNNDISTNESSPSRFVGKVYVTNKSETAMNFMDSLGVDFQRGRPDIPALIGNSIAMARRKESKRIAVITCGPQSLVESVKQACREMQPRCVSGQNRISIDLHEEVFQY